LDFTLNEALDKARAAAVPEIPPPITITEGVEEFFPSMCRRNRPGGKHKLYSAHEKKTEIIDLFIFKMTHPDFVEV
jgi:hypothetical protein